MTTPTAARPVLERLLASGEPPAEDLGALAALGADALEETLLGFARDHGARAVTLLGTLGTEDRERTVRRAARRALYRLGQPAPAAAPRRPSAARSPARPVHAWLSGIDGSGSRAAWILVEGARGELRLCSLLLNDVAGILDVAGGDITKKRLKRELDALRASQKLPWVEAKPERALGLVAEALALHRAHGTAPPAGFARWAAIFESIPPSPPGGPPAESDPRLVERSGTLLDLPELAGWFLEPERVQADAVEVLQARESRLVVSEQIRTERLEAVISRVVERELDEPARRLWAGRLMEMARVFESDRRAEPAALSRAAAAGLLDPVRDPLHHPFARRLAARAVEVAGEVALGRVSAADVSRAPRIPRSTGQPSA